MNFKKGIIALAIGVIALGAVSIGTGIANAQSGECTTCDAPKVEAPGPSVDYNFDRDRSPDNVHVFVSQSEPERMCVSRTVSADLDTAIHVGVESIDPSPAPWEPSTNDMAYSESGRSTMSVEACIVMRSVTTVRVHAD